MAKHSDKSALKAPLTFNAAFAQMRKKYGSNTIMLAREINVVTRIPIGIPSLDFQLGGGLPMGRIVHVSGDQHCVDAATHIMYSVYNEDGSLVNCKGATIAYLYKHFNGLSRRSARSKSNAIFIVPSVHPETNCVVKNKIVDVIKTGRKECVEVILADGKKLICTKEHKIYVGGGQFTCAGDLKPMDVVYVHNNEPHTRIARVTRYKEVFVKKHPKREFKVIEGKHRYCRVKVCEAVVEAAMNGMSYAHYIKVLNTADWDTIDALERIPDGHVVHHIDWDSKNDSLDNLVVFEDKEHRRYHARASTGERIHATPVAVASISDVGARDTYDIKCQSPFNSYVANRIFVHNSGKTFLAMQIAAAMQRFYGDKMVFWLDGERSFDSVRAEQIGIDLDRIIVSRPSSSEAGLEELIEMAPFISGGFVDSVASLSTVTESEGTMADKQVGAVAALLSKFFHKWISATSPEKLDGLVPMLTLTNQLRDDIGSYIKRTKTPGGRSMQHYPSVFIELSRGPVVKLKERDAEDEEVVIGHDVKFKIKKNNTFQPDKVGAFMLCTRPYDIGGYQLSVNQVDWPRDLLKYAVHYNVIKRSGSWHEFKGKSKMKAQGRVEAQAKLYHDGELTAEIQELVLAEVFRSHGVKTNNDQAQVEAPGKAGGKKVIGKKPSWQRK